MSLVEVSGDILRVHGDLVEIGRETAGYDLHQECPKAAADLFYRQYYAANRPAKLTYQGETYRTVDQSNALQYPPHWRSG